jgi:hypothetical protein
MNLGTKVCRIR